MSPKTVTEGLREIAFLTRETLELAEKLVKKTETDGNPQPLRRLLIQGP